MRIIEYDPIDIPEDRAREQEPIRVIQRGHPAWPGAELEIRMDYNTSAEYWVWSVIKTDQEGSIIASQPAEYGRTYAYGDYIFFMFMDLAVQDEVVAPATLGSSVDLMAFPGPSSPGYKDWLDRQDTDQAEYNALINEWEKRVIPNARR